MYPWMKMAFDRFFSLMGLLLLSPLFLLVALWIKLDSPGPVFFRQRRIGYLRKEFYLIKFRTMRADTPSDIPTHLMSEASRFITMSGRFLRKTSLDELPQLINVLKGEMSLVGPRPALWNQADLIKLREERHVHSVKPGITGYAQVQGRDELPIPDKAALDGYYVQHQSLWFDLKVLFMTVGAVLNTKGVAEGDEPTNSKGVKR